MAKKILSIELLLILALGAASCGEIENPVPDGTIAFDLYESGLPVEGLQNFVFGESRDYELQSWFVTTMQVSVPEGWSADFYREGDNGTAVITPPASASDGVAAGDIRVVLTGPQSQSKTYELPVTVN